MRPLLTTACSCLCLAAAPAEAPGPAVSALLQQAIAAMDAWARTSTPQDQRCVQSLAGNLETVAKDFATVSE